MGLRPVSVSQLNTYIKRVLGTDPLLMNISVCGEVSNLTRHSSGHWYFNLKDEGGKVNCFLPSNRVSQLRFDLSEGMQIIAHGSISVYERGGSYSLSIREIDADGEGALNLAFENLKRKLDAEGLFAPEHKRPIPLFPRRIGVVTSPTGAAIKDIITTVRRRSNLVDILLCPCLVQGADAAPTVCDAIKILNERFPEIDLIIVGRGGGSQEDLWVFNEESVARAVYDSRIPVISAVGHERDIVITDLAADLRAATPTAAAELAVPDSSLYRDAVERFSPLNLYAILEDRIANGLLRTASLKESLDMGMESLLRGQEHRLEMLKADIDSVNPLNILGRGYAAVRRNGKWITDAAELKTNDLIEIVLKNGTASAVIQNVEERHDKSEG